MDRGGPGPRRPVTAPGRARAVRGRAPSAGCWRPTPGRTARTARCGRRGHCRRSPRRPGTAARVPGRRARSRPGSTGRAAPRGAGRRARPRSACARRLCEPRSFRISLTRGNHCGSDGRNARNGRSSQNQVPLPHSYAPASAATTDARVSSAYVQISPSICLVDASDAFTASAMRVASSYANASFTCARIDVCCITFAAQPRDHHTVVDLDVTVDEDSLARYLDVVEHDERVLFVEAGRERVVEGGPRERVAVAAQHVQPGRSPSGSENAERVLRRPGLVRAAAARGRRRARRRTAPASRGTRAPRTTMPCSVSRDLVQGDLAVPRGGRRAPCRRWGG